MDRFIRQMIGPVLDYDLGRGAELRRTLEAYFTCDGNLSRTAATLYVHINTLYQRIDRITTLLGGPGWRHGDQALQVHLALKLHTFTHEAPCCLPRGFCASAWAFSIFAKPIVGAPPRPRRTGRAELHDRCSSRIPIRAVTCWFPGGIMQWS
ncbi:MAG TPA: helix-turn-helix domain-containing protein, partial [Streptosporangiaceae bacterium]|nr:helix-turn-helix domain-containing protein [Streptosporangiaceae bacterium]